MFCWAVVRPKGYEPGLMEAQYLRGAGIFRCDQYAVLCNGDDLKLGKEKVLKIPDTGDQGAEMGDLNDRGTTTNSWLNAFIFIKAWKVIQEETPALRHDWTVKVDPDAVFFPDRLRYHVADHTPAQGEGESLYIANCDRDFNHDAGDHPAQLFGSLEVFSREALRVYLDGAARCQDELDWKGWGEDYFMSHCMDHLGVGRIDDFGMLSDKRCWIAECTDTWKVAFHDFKDEESWFDCWEKSIGENGKLDDADEESSRQLGHPLKRTNRTRAAAAHEAAWQPPAEGAQG